MIHNYLIYYGTTMTGVADAQQIEDILSGIKPLYDETKNVRLGSGEIQTHRNTLSLIYDGLSGVTNIVDHPDSLLSSITGKTKVLMAIWGETPGFHSITGKRLRTWRHCADAELLVHLKRGKAYYDSSQFCDIIEQLHNCVSIWPQRNQDKVFSNSFIDLCGDIPQGRVIDIIYNWKLGDNRIPE